MLPGSKQASPLMTALAGRVAANTAPTGGGPSMNRPLNPGLGREASQPHLLRAMLQRQMQGTLPVAALDTSAADPMRDPAPSLY